MGSWRWYAATEAGILHSDDQGANWIAGGPVEKEKSFVSVSAHDGAVAAASVRQVWYSANYGQRWSLRPLPPEVRRVYSVTVTGEGEVWAATREGALHWIRKSPDSKSLDNGSWEYVANGLPEREVTSIREEGGLLLAAVAASNRWYVSRDKGRSWAASEPADFEVTGAVMLGGTLYITTRHHGILVPDPQARAAEPHPEGAAAR
jgi:photosystem II stability/assembly factor-like uncharacterized protein